MKCNVCKTNIAAGVEAQKMIVEYIQDDTTTRFFGYMMSDGTLAQATGRIVRAFHHKCYHAARKRAARGDAVTGRVLAGGPTAYEITALGLDPGDIGFLDTRQYSAKLDRLHAVAQRVGKAVGDLTVLEAFWADEQGGPYDHGHQFPLETYQLMAHIGYAHGHAVSPGQSVARLHDRLHAQLHQQAIERIRNTEKEIATPARDWREQFTAEISKDVR